MKHLRIVVQGRVQGVFYRASTLDKAHQLQIQGYVKNQSDGSVMIHAEGVEDDLDRFVEWCWKGPANANVLKVEVKVLSLENFKGFKIKKL